MTDKNDSKTKAKRSVIIAVIALLTIAAVICVILNNTSAKRAAKALEALRNASVGDYITFGSYEQDNVKINGTEPIEWQVLEKKDGKALVLSKYALERMPFHEEAAENTWETCSIRSWLNDEFFDIAFSNEEQAAVAETLVKNEDNPEYGTEGGKDTGDKVFLLSVKEATTYFNPNVYAEDALRRAKLTPRLAEYEKTREIYAKDGNGRWWLRTPGAGAGCTAGVDVTGEIDWFFLSHILFYCVRPAIWITY